MELGRSFTLDFIISNPSTGSPINADSTPSVDVFEDFGPDPMYSPVPIQRGVLDGHYCVTIEATTDNGFEKGKSYNVAVSATVSGTFAKTILSSFLIDDVMDKKTNVAALLNDVPIPDSFVPDYPALTIEQPMSMEDKFGSGSSFEFQDEFMRDYDLDNKVWREDSLTPDEVRAVVDEWQAVVDTYGAAYADWKAQYDIERIVQWRATLADRLITVTE